MKERLSSAQSGRYVDEKRSVGFGLKGNGHHKIDVCAAIYVLPMERDRRSYIYQRTRWGNHSQRRKKIEKRDERL